MTPIDHAAEALGLRALASEAPTEAYAANLLAAAKAHATLALVNEQRIANIIAYVTHADGLAQGHKEWLEEELGL